MATKKKFKWTDPTTGYSFMAGGILFYDSKGVWVVGEKENSYSELVSYTDPGGRYTPEDGNIWVTIKRELFEETYGMVDIAYKDILTMKETSQAYVNGHDHQVSYVCLVVDVTSHPDIVAALDPELFLINRERVVSENQNVSPSYYKPSSLEKLSYDEIGTLVKEYSRSGVTPKLGYRLMKVLEYAASHNMLPI